MKVATSVRVGAALALALSTAMAAQQPSSNTRAIVKAFQTTQVLAKFDHLPEEITWANDAAVSLHWKKHAKHDEDDECEEESHGGKCKNEGKQRHGRHGRKESHGKYGKEREKDEDEESYGHGKHSAKKEKKSHGKYGKKKDKESHGKHGEKTDDDEARGCGKKRHVRGGEGDDEACGGRGENVTLKFAATLQQDTESFIADVRDWVNNLVGNVSGSILVVDTTFTVSASGKVDTRHPCGGLVTNKMFPIVEQFIEDPVNAELTKTEARKILWRPSRDCLDQRNAVEVDGGAHAEFEVLCGEAPLLNATVATGGVSRKIFWHNLQFSGALVSVDILNGSIKAVGASGLIDKLIKIRNAPENTAEILGSLTNAVRACAANSTLVVRGLVGGGWRQAFSESGFSWDDEEADVDEDDEEEEAVVGYAEAFELSYKAGEEPSTDAPETEKPPTDSPADTKNPGTKMPTEEPTAAPKVTPTAPPVEKPTHSPTKAPPEDPTKKPNESPIEAPAQQPTTTPTGAPTEAPTKAPTKAPSKVPTEAPTKAPTKAPAVEPIKAPTEAPTEAPTKAPIRAPTKAPTDATNAPADGPTDVPTKAPIKAPTEAPTEEPTKPTEAPTEAPIKAPGKAPTDAPTPAPVKPDAPTQHPTPSPTGTPAGSHTDAATAVAQKESTSGASIGDLTTGKLKDLSEAASALYVQSGLQCHDHDISKACFMNTAMSKVVHGKMSTVQLAMSHKEEEDFTPFSFFSSPLLVVIALVGVAVGASYRTFKRRAGYRPIPTVA